MSLSEFPIATLWDVQRYNSLESFDRALLWYCLETWHSNIGNIIRRILDSIHGKDRESENIPILTDHICRRCEYVMRKNDTTHHLARFVPRDYTDEWDYLLGFLDSNKEEFATFCMYGLEESRFRTPPKSGYSTASVIEVPLAHCNSFQERKK